MALRITVLGRGAWGGTLARLWEARGHQVRSWSRRDGGSPVALLAGSDLVVVAVAMAGVEGLAAALAPGWPLQLPLLSCSKGIHPSRLCTASRLWGELLPQIPIAVLSGPNLARELDQGLPAASVIASRSEAFGRRLQSELRAPHFRLYTNRDPIGTEVAAALKNVMAVAAGISDGLELGANAKASLLCRGLAEMGLLLRSMDGHLATLYGLAGLGDLLATANSSLSRNYRFGRLLAEGLDESQALQRIKATVEAPETARGALRLAQRCGLRLPICGQVVDLLAGRVDARGAVRALMERDPRSEAEF